MPVAPPLRKQVLQGYMPLGSISWLNDEQLVFHGAPIGSNGNKNSLYLWDPQSKPRELLKGSHNSCVSNEIIRTLQYPEQGPAKPLILKKPDFTPLPYPRRSTPKPSVSDPVSCTTISTPEALRDRRWKPLRLGQGYLDFGPREDATGIRAVEHLANDQRSRHNTGIRMEQPISPKTEHAAHDDSYLIFDLNLTKAQRQLWLKTDKHTIWRLDRHLQGWPLTIPAGRWVNPIGGTLSYLSTRSGILIISNNFAPNYSAGGAGLYLLAPNTAAQRLERGLAQEVAVSPNGCRIAYGFRPRLDTGLPEGGPRLVVLDLCSQATTATTTP